ncbi:DUF4194 domain-containing protein [Streptomyces sp. Mo3]|uniref:DUF4194 domain-containing protein n=1 Tax=Streptomyces sp. Mo3 TaxID=3161190 RepID=UPI0039F138C1
MSDALTAPVVHLLKAGVLYQGDAPLVWEQILAQQAAIGDYLAVIGLDVVVDRAEGYAYVRQQDSEARDDGPPCRGWSPATGSPSPSA